MKSMRNHCISQYVCIIYIDLLTFQCFIAYRELLSIVNWSRKMGFGEFFVNQIFRFAWNWHESTNGALSFSEKCTTENSLVFCKFIKNNPKTSQNVIFFGFAFVCLITKCKKLLHRSIIFREVSGLHFCFSFNRCCAASHCFKLLNY